MGKNEKADTQVLADATQEQFDETREMETEGAKDPTETPEDAAADEMDMDDVAEEAAKPEPPAGEKKEPAPEGQRQGRPQGAPRTAEVTEEEETEAEAAAEESGRWKEGGEGEEGEGQGTHVGPLKPEAEQGAEGAATEEAAADEMEAE